MIPEYNPLISVVMSVYNSEAFLRQAIESILNQTFKEFEFIIINDGSSDSSLKIMHSFSDKRIKIIDQNNKGLSVALNTGIKQAKGEYIARMDADDISIKHRLEKQIAFFKTKPKCVLVGSNANLMDINGNYLYTTELPEDWHDINKLLPENSIFHSSAMFKKSAWALVGGYREDIVHHFEDKILWNSFSKIGEIYNLRDVLLYYRLVPSSISNIDGKTINLFREICNKVIIENTISEEDKETLETLSRNNKNKRMGNYFFRLGSIYQRITFNRKAAIQNFFKSLRYCPLDPRIYFNILLSLMPKTIIKAWKERHYSKTEE